MPAEVHHPRGGLVGVGDLEVRHPVRAPVARQRAADAVQRGHRAAAQMQRLVVEVGRDDRFRLESEDRLVELGDRRGLAGHQLVPDRGSGSPRERRTDVRRGLPDPENGPARVGDDGHPARVGRVERTDADRPPQERIASAVTSASSVARYVVQATGRCRSGGSCPMPATSFPSISART